MTPDALRDHVEITQALYRYADAIDRRDFAQLDSVFTPDATIHYDVPGGTKLPFKEMVGWLETVLGLFNATQHCVSNPLVQVDGESAQSTCYLNASHEQVSPDGKRSTFVDHGTYTDRWVRTPAGWRIRERVLRRMLLEGQIQGRAG